MIDLKWLQEADDKELIETSAQLDLDATAITNKITVAKGLGTMHADWAARASAKCRHLRAEKRLIDTELNRRNNRRRVAANKAAQEERVKAQADRAVAHAEILEQQKRFAKANHEAKLRRIQASKDTQQVHYAEFKEVVKELVGLEMYVYAWELTRKRLAEKGLS